MVFIQKELQKFADLRGFIGVSVSNIDGKILGQILTKKNINTKRLTIIMSHALNKMKMATNAINLGDLEFLELDTSDMIAVVKCYHVNNVHFHMIAILDRHEGNPAMFKSIMTSVADILAENI